LANSPQVAFGIDGIVTGIMEKGQEFSGQAVGAAFAVLGLIVFFHLVEGAAELAKERPCRLFDGMFYLRLGMVFVLLISYQAVFFGLAKRAIPGAMKGFNESWGLVWVNQQSALEELKVSSDQNQEVKRSEVGATKAAQKDDDASWYEKLAVYVVDGITTDLGRMSAGLLAVLLMAFLLMEGFWAMGVATLTLAIGPLCVATLAHEKVEGVFWTFIRTCVVYVLLYLPLLHLACSFAGVIMADMTTMRGDAEIVLGDGADIGSHFVMVLLGPLLALAIVRAANGTITALVQSFGPGSGSAFAGAVGMAQNAGQAIAPALMGTVNHAVGGPEYGESNEPKGGGGEKGNGVASAGTPALGAALRGET
jgi:hypothetical protein